MLVIPHDLNNIYHEILTDNLVDHIMSSTRSLANKSQILPCSYLVAQLIPENHRILSLSFDYSTFIYLDHLLRVAEIWIAS